jgi:uncharacterized protein YpbB/energy-coupling factor transporter ATP-binding protein EcfA2
MSNIILTDLAQLASLYVNNTNKHIFLTGKAGTGKTTFLKQIIKITHKNTIIAAPTGIAAINAGGVTLHSLFQLPFGAFIPQNNIISDSVNFQLNTPKSLLSSMQMNKYKRKLLQEMELLIIDEVSMLRADLLDAINIILQKVRRNSRVFGGVQILFIGDMFQLPPIVKDDEWNILKHFYEGMYFFNAVALQNNTPVFIELDTIFRQSDTKFIELLSHVREGNISQSDISTLNKYYKPAFKPKPEEGYIFLTTHNFKADQINTAELNKLNNKEFFYDAEVTGDFSEYNYPVEYTLKLKEGAQVMFIKNDYSGEHRYFNGKIGIISQLSEDEIIVKFSDESEPVSVETYQWENKRFTLNKSTNEIEEKVIGTFTHFPLKLAWAITIHKSQGLTFEKAIIDISRAFAPGQVYVALSRLTSLNGLVLISSVPKEGLEQDNLIYQFATNRQSSNDLKQNIKKHSIEYVADYIMQAFDFSKLTNFIYYHLQTYNKDEARSEKQKNKQWVVDLLQNVKVDKEVADKFLNQIKFILLKKDDNTIDIFNERLLAAKGYFEPKLKNFSENINSKTAELKGVKGVKKYITELNDIENEFIVQLGYIYKAEALIKSIIDDEQLLKSKVTKPDIHESGITEKKKAPRKSKKVKIDTKKESLKLYLDGLSIDEIAKKRELKPITIEGHLAHFVEEGVVDVLEFVEQDKLNWVAEIAGELETTALGPVKEIVLDDLSWSEIRFAMAHYKSNLHKTDF